MSVLRGKRKVAFTEFERQMGVICRVIKDRLNSVPARYRKFINPKLYEPANKAYTAVILANEQSPRTAQGLQRRNALFDTALKSILQMQKPLIAYGVTKRQEAQPMIVALPKEKMKRLAFLNKMGELHKYTYQKIGHAPNDCKDFISGKIADFVDTALYAVVMANHKIPETKDEAEKREKNLQLAIDSINGMQRPLLALWNIMDYSESVMDEWAGLLDEELKILEGLKTADKARYKSLR